MNEHVVLLDDTLKPIGSKPKSQVHHANTPLHLAFSIFLFNSKGEVLLQQRAATKKTWPGIWSNSVCGHPQPGESLLGAAKRRLQYELAITLPQNKLRIILKDYRYRYSLYGVVENELCPVIVAHYDGPIAPNPSEVASVQWVDWKAFLKTIQKPNEFSQWCVEEAQLLNRNPQFNKFLLQK